MRHRARTLVVYALLLALGAWVIARATFTADLSAFLPATPDASQRLLIEQLQQGVAARSLMVGIEGGDETSRARASKALAQALRAQRAFSSVNNGEREDYTSAGERLMTHRYLLSDAVTDGRFDSVDGLRAALQDTALRLASPEGAAFKPLWPRDPTGEMLRVAESLLPAQAPRTEQGVWVSRDGKRAVLLLTLVASVSDIDAQAAGIDAVRQTFAGLQMPTLTLQISGAGVFAQQSRSLIEREVHRLSVFGALGVVLLLWLSFGRVAAVGLAAVPVVSGVLAGVAGVSLVFGTVHGMTLGFGAALVGEAVDYGIYYLIQARPRAGSRADDVPTEMTGSSWWREGWPTVRLGVLTSLCGFAALVFSGFPGLAQIGVFALFGLVAAALVTRFVLPLLAPQGAAGGGLRQTIGRGAAAALQRLRRVRAVALAAIAAALVALVVVPKPMWRGDLQSLSPVPRSALTLDATLRADVGAQDARTVVVAQGATQDEALAAAERASTVLDTLVFDGVLAGYETPTRLVPSRATQEARRKALPARDVLAPRLDAAVQGLPFRATQVSALVDEVAHARTLPPFDATHYRDTPLAAALDAWMMKRADGSWAVLLPLQWPEHTASAGDTGTARLRTAVANQGDVVVLDIKQSLDDLYARYVREALWQSLLGALAVVALLAWVLRDLTRLLRVVVPLAATVLTVVAVLAWSGVALGILHLVGLLLTVAVGSNYALFFDQLAHASSTPVDADAAAHSASVGHAHDTLASLVLANITTVWTFGVMALSDIAALAAIGQAVAPGALLSLLFSAVLIQPRRRDRPTLASPEAPRTPVT